MIFKKNISPLPWESFGQYQSLSEAKTETFKARKEKTATAIDFSDNAENALGYAVQFIKKFKVHVYLLYVYKRPLIATEVPVYGELEQEVKKVREIIHKNLQAASDYIHLADPEVACSSLIEEGAAAPKILAAIKTHRIDMVIMSSKAGSMLGSVLFGNVTTEVLKDASCPVLVVPENFSFSPIHNIVYASVFLDSDVAKINQLSIIAKAFDANITVLHISEEDQAHRNLWLENFSELVKETVSYPKLTFLSLKGAEAVISLQEYMQEHPVDMLVMNTIHRIKYEKIYNPSITEKLSYRLELPLLVFHNEQV